MAGGFVTRPCLAGLAVALVLSGGCGGAGGGAVDREVVAAYCNYGATTTSELNACLDHVPRGYVDGLKTNAARFAVGKLDDCLADAGPFCRKYARIRLDYEFSDNSTP